jgi:hypothetical protein
VTWEFRPKMSLLIDQSPGGVLQITDFKETE